MMILSVLLTSLLVLSRVSGSGIVGGKESDPLSHRYMVSVQWNGKHSCGGMLIAEDYVLTAAHCLKPVFSSGRGHLEVVVGAHNVTEKEKNQQRIQVTDYFRYPKNKNRTDAGDYSADIALLKLEAKAQLNEFVKVLNLPTENSAAPANQMCTMAGWGMREPGGKVSDVLYETTLMVLATTECKRLWGQYFDSDVMMCTDTSQNTTFCQGDSGGPLVCNSIPQGLAIYTYWGACNNDIYPGVYIRIPPFIPWIKETMNKK